MIQERPVRRRKETKGREKEEYTQEEERGETESGERRFLQPVLSIRHY